MAHDLEKVVQAEKMQPPINDPPPTTTTNESTYTPASRSIYRVAVEKIELMNSLPAIRIEGNETEPPAYAKVQCFDEEFQSLQRRQRFDCICESVKYLDVKKLSAEDYEASPRYEGVWDTWIQILMGAVTMIQRIPPHLEDLYEFHHNKYRDQIVANAMLVRPAIQFLLFEIQPTNPKDAEENEWALNQKAQTLQYIVDNGTDLDGSLNEIHHIVDYAIQGSLDCVLAKYCVEALLELQPREPELDNWLHHQMRICEDWFEKNNSHLERLPGIAWQLHLIWVFRLWQQWDVFLRDGFDLVLAESWEPPILKVLLDSKPNYIQNLEVGCYPPQALPEEGDYDIRPDWLQILSEIEPVIYQGYEMTDYEVDVMATIIDDTMYMAAPSEEGYMFARIPPPYSERKEQGRISMKEVVSKLLPIWDRRNKQPKRSVVTWLTRAMTEKRLDASSVEWINVHLKAWSFVDPPRCSSHSHVNSVQDRNFAKENLGEGE